MKRDTPARPLAELEAERTAMLTKLALSDNLVITDLSTNGEAVLQIERAAADNPARFVSRLT